MKKALIFGLLTLVVLGLAYGSGIGYYAEKFQANTSFGNIDISNLSLAEAQERIEADINQQTVTMTENGKELGTFSMADLNAQVNTQAFLESSYNNQDPTQWLMGFFTSVEYDNVLMNHIRIDDAAIESALANVGISNEGRIAAQDATIDYAEGRGYFVVPEEKGTQLDIEKIKELVVAGIQSGSSSVEINETYSHPEVTAEDEKITGVMAQIDKISNTKITLTIAGSEEVIPKEMILDWMYFDDNNQVVFDEVMIHEWLATLNDKYATFDDVRQFASTLRGTVEVPAGTLGWSIDREGETQAIAADLYAGVDVTREPAIVGTGYANALSGESDIGKSYVEVDMVNQMMYVYVDGARVIETPIVTGQVGTSTVPGAYSVWNKETDTELKGFNDHTGVDYVQPVSFWIPFDDTGQGIHDANWQPSFGGDIYLTNGSLGCINTPPGIMAQVFEHVTLGMPVIVFA